MKLPPMNALRAFEAVSRHGSVSAAADDLCVSQGAVSQQIRNLEDFLGRELFDRTANSIELSEDGKAFASVVQTSLADIAAAPVIDRVQLLNLSDLWQGLDALRDWIARLTNRPAYQRALPKERMLDLLS